jgi:guanylate kinase
VQETIGNVFIVAAPSGGGKTSLVKKLAKNVDNLVVSISHTTRPCRPGEENGVDYFFVDDKSFSAMVDAHDFFEYARVFNAFYGTSRAQILNRLHAGQDVILDIDWQGAQQIKSYIPAAVTIFILPPSMTVLQERLFARNQDDLAIIHSRMQQARDEMLHYSEFDYLVVNDDFELALEELSSIVCAERLRTRRQLFKQEKLLSLLFAT